MGLLKQAYMSATMDDMGNNSELVQEHIEQLADELRNDGVIPDEVYKQSQLSHYTIGELCEEIRDRADYMIKALDKNYENNKTSN